MLSALKWFTVVLAALIFSLVGFCVIVAIEPYRQVTTELHAAPPLDTYPPLVVTAVLVAVDPEFLESPRTEAIRRLFQALYFTPGEMLKGSTLTGQLIRSTIVTLRYRHINELSVTTAVDALWPKNQILSAYLGKVYLGTNASGPIYGFKKASSAYFQKPLESLSVAEVALLAALIRGPSYFSPIQHPERALQRRANVLQSLKDRGAITESQFNEAVRSPIPKQV